MKDAAPQPIYLKDYKKPDYLIDTVHLTFDLHNTETKVCSRLNVKRNYQEEEPGHVRPLTLHGEELKLVKISIDGEELKEGEYDIADDVLVIAGVPEKFTLEIENMINPEANKALDGLYKSGSIFCTQCEPEGFRRITYYLDRPDVMAKFTTKIIADKELYPVLLSNGNPIGEGELDGGRHWVEWEDPFLKPAYLYALVAGELGLVQGSFTTMSGREIDLRIYCDKGNESKCTHALESLKNSMKWDEETFGLEYDLDIYMIVAVDSFNMGAMENKGLNIFNSVYVLADQKSATDDNFLGIESVVGHEYFHNWTGNRITCRDWFQLTLKEGLTVYRDQEFSSDLNSRTVQRIGDVDRLRTHQFVEDAGPTSHPIKPSSYIEMNNFYTSTVYEKGAEVIRMVRTFLGKEGFRKGMDKYFELFDGQAVTTEDFLHAMSAGNDNFDFTQFKNWYHQSGTPEIEVHWEYDALNKTCRLNIEQSCPPTPGQEHKQSFHFPLGIGLVNKNGQDLQLHLKESTTDQPFLDQGILNIKKQVEGFVFEHVNEEPVVSINRGFSAPVKLHAPYHLNDLIFLMANDNDEFNRYEAAQSAASRLIYKMINDIHEGRELSLDKDYIAAYGALLKDKELDPAFKSMLLNIPSEAILHQGHSPIDFDATFKAREFVIKSLALAHRDLMVELYDENKTPGEYKLDPVSIGKRDLRNQILGFISSIEDQVAIDLCKLHFDSATNMTDEISALISLMDIDCEEGTHASAAFYEKWKGDTLVMQKWLAAEAGSCLNKAYDRVLALENDPVYDKTVPNLARALIGAFARNFTQFNHTSGRGYKLVADRILEIDKLNPQMASRLINCFKDYKKVKAENKAMMEVELKRIKETEGLSKNVFEIVSKILH